MVARSSLKLAQSALDGRIGKTLKPTFQLENRIFNLRVSDRSSDARYCGVKPPPLKAGTNPSRCRSEAWFQSDSSFTSKGVNSGNARLVSSAPSQFP